MVLGHKSPLITYLFIPQVNNKSDILKIENIVGQAVVDNCPLSGGSVGQVFRITMSNGTRLVAKVDNGDNPQLDIEGYMLQFLTNNSQLPVPKVLHKSPNLLLMSFIPGSSTFTQRAHEHAADLLAHLHQIQGPAFGLERDTLIGGLHQPNPWTDSWQAFFRDHRLLYMAQQCMLSGRFSSGFYARLERFAGNLEKWLLEPQYPALIHGDVWTGNVLALGDKISGFVDPAIYYGSPEIELAFSTLFGTFGDWFFNRYQEINPIPPGFFEERKDIYNLYPLLVHVRLFGGSYTISVDNTLKRFGF